MISLPNDKELARLLKALEQFQEQLPQLQGPVPPIHIFVDEANMIYPAVEKLLFEKLIPLLSDRTELYLVTATPRQLLDLVRSPPRLWGGEPILVSAEQA